MKQLSDHAVLMAMDGKHWEIAKKGTAGKMWDYFTANKAITEHLALNKFAKFRLVNLKTKQVIGELPRRRH